MADRAVDRMPLAVRRALAVSSQAPQIRVNRSPTTGFLSVRAIRSDAGICRIGLGLAIAAVAVAGCAAQKRPPPSAPSGTGASGPPPHVTSCREYADQMAGRQLQQDLDSISGNFRGGDSRVFGDFARMDAKKYYQQLYESCLSNQRARRQQLEQQLDREQERQLDQQQK